MTELLQTARATPATVVAVFHSRFSEEFNLSMASPTLMYGRRYQKGVNRITAVAMTAFHIGAVAAFFFIDSGAILTASLSTSWRACWASGWRITACSRIAGTARYQLD